LRKHLVSDVATGVGLGNARALVVFSIGVFLPNWHLANLADNIEPDTSKCPLNLNPCGSIGIIAEADELGDRNGRLHRDELEGGSMVEDPLPVAES
jgi:hypothetical protein